MTFFFLLCFGNCVIMAGIITSPSVMKVFAGLWEIYAVFCDGSSSADIFSQLSIFRRRLGKQQFNNRRLLSFIQRTCC